MSTVAISKEGHEVSQQRLLMFRLFGHQVFGINVLKIKEIIPYHALNKLPGSHAAVLGLARLRGQPFPVIDMAAAIGMRPAQLDAEVLESSSIIISEFNRSLQGFMVSTVDKIVTLEWEDVRPPPRVTGRLSYITGVVQVDSTLVEVIDVERILTEVAPPKDSTGKGLSLTDENLQKLREKLVLVVDDSSMARKQISQTLAMIGLDYVVACDGKEALQKLHELHDEGRNVDLIISDIEMPEMDGYTLTREIRKDEGLSSVYVLLHTSLAGAVSRENAEASGADAALTKFVTEELAEAVIQGLAQESAEHT